MMKESPQGYTCEVKYFLKNTSDTEAEAIKNKRKNVCCCLCFHPSWTSPAIESLARRGSWPGSWAAGRKSLSGKSVRASGLPLWRRAHRDTLTQPRRPRPAPRYGKLDLAMKEQSSRCLPHLSLLLRRAFRSLRLEEGRLPLRGKDRTRGMFK